MSSCMHCCWLSTRVLYSATGRARYPSPHTTLPRDGVVRWFCSRSTPALSNHPRGNLDNNKEPHIETQPQTQNTSTQTQADTLTNKLASCSLSNSPKHLQKPVVPKLSHISLISLNNNKPEEPQSCEDVRPSFLTNTDLFGSAEMSSKRSQNCLTPERGSSKKKKKDKLCLDQEFIPISSITKSQEQEDEFGSDFFIIDTSPSEVVFNEVNKSSRKSEGKSSGAKSSSVKKLSDNVVSSSSDVENKSTSKKEEDTNDDIEIVEAKCVNNRTSLKDTDKTKTKRKHKYGSPRRKSLTKVFYDPDDIDVVFESPRKTQRDNVKVVDTVSSSSPGRRNGIMKSTRPTSPITLGSPSTSQDKSILNINTTIDLCSPSTSQSTQVRHCHTFSKHGLKAKSPVDNLLHEQRDLRESSPGIKKVNVVDPDVVEIEDQPGCSSNSVPVEVISIFDDNDSDNTSGDETTPRIDVSNDVYVSLQKVKVDELRNKNIDLSDETLALRRRLEDLRRWDMTGLGQEVIAGRNLKPSDVTFTVMSYNVLAQSLLTDNQYLYRSCQTDHLTWEYRWALLQHEVEALDPDVMLLQEVQSSHYLTHYLPWFTYKGYEGLYKKRTGTKADGCAIFFKRSKFSLVEQCSIEYLQPEAQNVLNRDNIGLIAKLSSVAQPNAPPLCVATTHLLYNPRRHDVKLAQAVLLLTEIDRLCYEGEEGGRTKYCPIILSGDFNAEPHSTLMDFLKSGRLHYEGLSSKTLSRHGSFGSLLDSCLIPPDLGVTERCQHAVLAQSRFTERLTGPLFRLSDKRRLEESLIRLHHSDRSHSSSSERNSKSGIRGPCQSGWLSHGLNFKSVYNHRIDNRPEATTHQGSWTTVDYMLYNRIYGESRGQLIEGKLKLLARHRLLSGPEADRFGPLPSAVCPSDHFPLAAQFLLRR